jgi:predicted GH43/DUF377 family glycosyl hydrolase
MNLYVLGIILLFVLLGVAFYFEKSILLYLFLSVLTIVFLFQAHELKKVCRLTRDMYQSTSTVDTSIFPPTSHLPINLDPTTSGCVVSVKKIELDHSDAFNASYVVDTNNQKWIFYRIQDFSKFKPKPRKSFVYCQKVDENFEKQEPAFCVSSELGDYAEDARVFLKNDSLFCIYNELHPQNKMSRGISLARYDEKRRVMVPIQRCILNLQKVEKNWAPIIDNSDLNSLSLIYSFSPFLVFKADLKNTTITQSFHSEKFLPSYFPDSWIKKYGQPRGGTPAIRIGDRYLTFFHSSFINRADHRVWYVMGACTFTVSQPHGILSVSEKPILFESIYDTKNAHHSALKKCVLFPMSVEKEDNLLHVCCGENDSGVKMVTIDLKTLLQSLEPV